MHRWEIPTRAPYTQPLPDVGETEVRGSDVEIRIFIQTVGDALLRILAKLRQPEQDAAVLLRRRRMREDIAYESENPHEKRQEHGRGVRGGHRACVTPPDNAIPCGHFSELGGGMACVGEDRAPRQEDRILRGQCGLTLVREQSVRTAVRHGEQRHGLATQRGDEPRFRRKRPQQGVTDLGDDPVRDGQVRLGRRIIGGHEEDHEDFGRFAVRRRRSREIRRRSEAYWRPIGSPSSMRR